MAHEWDESLATVFDKDITHISDYNGGEYQEAVSALSRELPEYCHGLSDSS